MIFAVFGQHAVFLPFFNNQYRGHLKFEISPNESPSAVFFYCSIKVSRLAHSIRKLLTTVALGKLTKAVLIAIGGGADGISRQHSIALRLSSTGVFKAYFCLYLEPLYSD
jgi:hypothetical protein